MKYYIDTEFIEGFHKPLFGKRRHFIDLISIGIVDESGREYYAISKDFDLKAVWNKYDLKPDIDNGGMKKVYWLRDNVLKPIFDEWEMDANGKIVRLGLPIPLVEDKFTYKNFKKVIGYIGKSNKQIAEEIRNFVMMEKYDSGGQVILGKFFPNELATPEFYGYYSSYDWVLFCSLFGRMIDLPTGFPMYCNDLKQTLDSTVKGIDGFTFEQSLYAIKNDPNYPKQTNEHNSLSDARWNKQLHEFLIKL